ncbi:MAG: hypothetical protein AAGA84_06460 [Pseudomonadota bacterium]
MKQFIFALITLAAWSGAEQTHAHGAADNHLVVVISDTRVQLNIVVDERVLGIADADQNGRTTLSELQRRRAIVGRWFDTAVRINSDAQPPSVIFQDLTTDLDHVDHIGYVDHARVRRTLRFAATPDRLILDAAALAARIHNLTVSIIDTQSGQRRRLSGALLDQPVVIR